MSPKRRNYDDDLSTARRKQREAEDATCERDRWLGIAAHEIKTPLTSISGLSELMEHRLITAPVPLPPAQRRQLELALTFLCVQTTRLTRLVEQLLDFSRLQAHRIALQIEEVDLIALCYAQIVLAQATTESQSILLDAPFETLIVRADIVLLGQVLSNLLANAIRYAPDSLIVVRLRKDATAPATAHISVIDRGPGVPVEKRPRLFQRFATAEGEHEKGLGLGLWLSEQIVALHNGTITAQFPQDGGMTVLVRLPLARADVVARKKRGSA